MIEPAGKCFIGQETGRNLQFWPLCYWMMQQLVYLFEIVNKTLLGI